MGKQIDYIGHRDFYEGIVNFMENDFQKRIEEENKNQDSTANADVTV